MAPITRQNRLERIAQIKGDHQKRLTLHRSFLRRRFSKDPSLEQRIESAKAQDTPARRPSAEHNVTDRDFFKLPAELRNAVYASACREASPLFLDLLEPAPWMLASKQVLHESTPIYLESNVFRTLICSNTDYDDMSMAHRPQPRHSSMHISSRTLKWLDGALCTNAPLIRDIGFAFADDPRDRDCFFRLSYRHDKPVLSHGHCIMCDDEGVYDMGHPALSPKEIVKNVALGPACNAYHRMKRHHDEELQQWGEILKSFNISHLGLRLQDIEEIARALRNHYLAPYVAQANDASRRFAPKTNLMSTALIFTLAYEGLAQIKRELEKWDQAAKEAQEAQEAQGSQEARIAKSLRLRLDSMGRYETY